MAGVDRHRFFAHVKRVAALSIATGTETVITWDTAISNSQGIWSSTTNPSRLTIPWQAGRLVCLVHVSINYPANATGMRKLLFKRNGLLSNTPIRTTSMILTPTDAVNMNVLARMVLEGGDYIEALCHQTSGSSLDIAAEYTQASITPLLRLGDA